MDNKEMMNGRILSDEELEAVSGGKWAQVGAWNIVCKKYVCQMCGSTNPRINGHAPGCTVPAIARPQANFKTQYYSSWADAVYAETNGCWSCKHAKYGTQYPKDESDVWCQLFSVDLN